MEQAAKGYRARNSERMQTFLRLRDGNNCIWCNREFTNEYGPWCPTVEHLLPKSQGGNRENYNIALACSSCNNARSNMRPSEFAEKLLHKNRSVPVDTLIRIFVEMVKECERRSTIHGKRKKKDGQLDWSRTELQRLRNLKISFAL